ncbi:MAG: 5'/3'-nucleotidase SurE [Candidatus Omnitrophica bacterium]|nr:5'/3'-nucleotidase SurE [Candidatus Omnitrophota bacterium]
MHILLTNDDGIRAPGIAALFKQLTTFSRVTIVAPEGERSSISQAITLDHPLYHSMVPFLGKTQGHSLSGTPADCVKFALAVLLKKDRPDIIVSGINRGSNDGCSVFYSGTVAAAREGALQGLPSIAVSLDEWDNPNFAPSAIIGAKIVRTIINKKLPKGTFLNVNVPPGIPRGTRWTCQCRVPIHSEFRRRKDPGGREYYWLTGRPPAGPNEKTSDSYLLARGFATVTPVHCDSTDYITLKSYDNA